MQKMIYLNIIHHGGDGEVDLSNPTATWKSSILRGSDAPALLFLTSAQLELPSPSPGLSLCATIPSLKM